MTDQSTPTVALALVPDGPDAITITGLTVQANHGVFDFERRDGQPFVIDVTAWLNTAAAAADDDLDQTLHYGVLSNEIADAVAGEPVDLIETLAERVARVVLAHEVAERVRVTVHKPEAPIEVPFTDVSITITRRRA
ncbi:MULTISPECIES: dihydroneopterin aldolase [Subtercola]|uniref:7,8-dihydroneopterin aldolase n=1 Tax=Subtercola vilae TaxID=2056433 RepID=A0A4T2C7K3_9MICO|nr:MULTISPECIES: dihydroneopterin aldolase [Subtercola]MEA9984930.1 dihydroneopterin aldolase [Subtercola sp. RTI3]TIH40415.1 dihydroneopterin aldolase [Subtercola vilae]